MSDREDILAGLRAGKELRIVRRDDSWLPVVWELVAEGFVTATVVQLDEQSSEMRVRLTPEAPNGK